MSRSIVPFLVGCALAFFPLAAAGQVQVLETRPFGSTTGPRAAVPDKPCASDDFTIAEMGWPSAAILAHIHARVIAARFGCSVRTVPGDPEATISSMTTTRQPAVAPEIWASRHADIWNGALRAQALRAAGDTFSGGALEAWFVPRYVLENHPGLTAASQLGDYWRVFAPNSAHRAQIVSCPADWACNLLTAKMIAAYGLSDRFNAVEPFDRFTLDRTIADKVAQREPVLTYYWQPNGLISRLDLVALDMGDFDLGNAQCMAIADCMPFGASRYAPDTVVIALAEWVFVNAPEIAAYFGRAQMPLEEMNRLLAWQTEHEASPEEVATHFILTRPQIWRHWTGMDAETGASRQAR
ncbi:glycine betaine ABC transporter substrate-binding protein [Pelagibacterium limicola]|uniref:glycine betaine ABC transporter substrate-binding protein n=1 Tax=Pelagibacterium limicola TaxID=2791022 RepID=UPI0018AFF4F0|nr:glycine betaine ABC transporter substrate-binding protein [Pelagibacterium limicola]